MPDNLPDRMDPVLDLLNQRPDANWDWSFEPAATGESAINAVALCNAAILAYSPQTDMQTFLTKWHFCDFRPLRGHFTQGFVARHEDGSLVVAFRGTEPINADDWFSDINYHQSVLPGVPGQIHGGFAKALNEVLSEMIRVVAELDPEGRQPVFLAGHSLGGALAILAAAVLQFGVKRSPAGVYTYGQPRVGDKAFSSAYDQALGSVTFRYANDWDVVPHVPPVQLPAKVAFQAPPSLADFLRGLKNVPAEVQRALTAVFAVERFEHVGQLRLLLEDGSVVSDPASIEWQQREAIYSGTLGELIQHFPQLLRAQLGMILRQHHRISHHDPVRGYLRQLQARL